MENKTKIIIGVTAAVVVIGAAVVIIGKRKKQKEAIDRGDNVTPLPSGSTSSGSTSSGSTGFTTKAEGDAFRLWVNKKHPLYALSIVLDKSGAFDNSYIRKAYAKYGTEYKSESVNPQLLAAKYLGMQPTAGTSISVDFNGAKHKAVFYNNGRFTTHSKSGSGYISKGNYMDGGKILIITDGANAGKSLKNGSVWTNILNTL